MRMHEGACVEMLRSVSFYVAPGYCTHIQIVTTLKINPIEGGRTGPPPSERSESFYFA